MEKKQFGTLLMGVIGGLVFALGMCMCLIAEWNMVNPGIAVGCVGGLLLIATVIRCRKLAGMEPIHVSIKRIGKILYAFFAALVFGAGMCMTMVLEGMMVQGIIVGIVGIVLLLCLIPMCLGFKKTEA